MKTLDMITITNAVTDIGINVTQSQLDSLGIEKGSTNSLKDVDKEKLISMIEEQNYIMVPAGSPANVAFNMAYFNANAGLIGSLGDDWLGKSYLEYVVYHHIADFLTMNEGPSGICYTLWTPDGERTMIGDMQAASKFNPNTKMRKAKFMHTSAYELCSDADTVLGMLKEAKSAKAQISLDLASERAVNKMRDKIIRNIEIFDIIFTTKTEAEALIGLTTNGFLKEMAPIVVYKMGSEGSRILSGKRVCNIPSFPANVVNTTGAGDMYAAVFIHSLMNKKDLREAGMMASEYAARICETRMPHFSEHYI